jgi:multidrug efflux pump subunit AcrB
VGQELLYCALGPLVAPQERYFAMFVLITVALVYFLQKMPTSYLPDEDQGIMMMMASTPAGSTLEQTQKVVEGVSGYFLKTRRTRLNPS